MYLKFNPNFLLVSPDFCPQFILNLPSIYPLYPALSSEADVKRADLEGIKVRGKGCPKPIDAWVQCGVANKVLSVLKK